MEFEVRVVGGIESCFVSLPLSLIQILQSTHRGFLPPVLALELHSRRQHRSWHLAWSGSASTSPSIEVDQQLAECISLSDHTEVQVKVAANLPKATLVMIEPSTEDDWEILELNSELAEVAILKQVGIVHEGMKFPLWLHGHTVIVFSVVSTSPGKSVVQLVPGTEVAVAPKRRKEDVDSYRLSTEEMSVKPHLMLKALLRVQSPNRKLVHRLEVNGVELGVVLSSVALIHPETAEKFSLHDLQLVIIFPRLLANVNIQKKNDNVLRKGTDSFAKGGSFEGSSTSKETSRHSIIRLLHSDSVAKGHLMLPQSLCLYLGLDLHSWVYLKSYNVTPKKDIPSLKLSPCQFKFRKDEHPENNGLDMVENLNNRMNTNDLVSFSDILDWSLHEEVLAALSCGLPNSEGEATSKSRSTKGMESLIHTWLIGQLKEILLHTGGMDVNSMILGNATFIHFEVTSRSLKALLPSDASSQLRNRTGESAVEFLYLLTTTMEESSLSRLYECYDLMIHAEDRSIGNFGDLELALGKLELGDPVTFVSVPEKNAHRSFSSTISSLSWMKTVTSDVIDRLTVLLSPNCGKSCSTHDVPLPGHVLVHGPPGSGKTSLAMAVAKHIEEHDDILGHIVFISCFKLATEKTLTIRQAISGYLSESLDHAPSVVIFDDLDSLVSSSESEGSELSSSATALLQFLTDLMDEYGDKRRSSCGIGPVAFMASAQSLESLPRPLSSSGRFDFHVQLPAPAVLERGAILKNEMQKRSLQRCDDILSEFASKCDGYDAYDLELLVDRAVLAASGRYLPSTFEAFKRSILVREDFEQAIHEFLPISMRGITRSASDGGHRGWEDVGGLNDIRNAIQEMIELPSKFPNIFAHSPLRLRSNVLLYGPPGCGKTHIVGSAAAACSLRFIPVKGPELLNKYIGASEQAVRDIFSKAAAASPCLLFFDEFDSIAPKRGHDNTGVTDRVVNQLLTELDGVEALTGVFVFAATSRPDLLDAALLRPGRLDRLLFCDFPSWSERLDILKVLSKELPLASDVDLDAMASVTEGFSGADLQALLSDAQLASVDELVESGDADTTGRTSVISNMHLKSVASKARPSVSEAEKQRLYAIYNQFLDSKRSVSAQSRDAKGKRATLA